MPNHHSYNLSHFGIVWPTNIILCAKSKLFTRFISRANKSSASSRSRTICVRHCYLSVSIIAFPNGNSLTVKRIDLLFCIMSARLQTQCSGCLWQIDANEWRTTSSWRQDNGNSQFWVNEQIFIDHVKCGNYFDYNHSPSLLLCRRFHLLSSQSCYAKNFVNFVKVRIITVIITFLSHFFLCSLRCASSYKSMVRLLRKFFQSTRFAFFVPERKEKTHKSFMVLWPSRKKRLNLPCSHLVRPISVQLIIAFIVFYAHLHTVYRQIFFAEIHFVFCHWL